MHFVRACVWVWSQTVNQGQTLEWDRQTGREGGAGTTTKASSLLANKTDGLHSHNSGEKQGP